MPLTSYEQERHAARRDIYLGVQAMMQSTAHGILKALRERGMTVKAEDTHDNTENEFSPSFSISTVDGEYVGVAMKAEETKRNGERVKSLNGKVYIQVGRYRRKFNQPKDGFDIPKIVDCIAAEVESIRRNAKLVAEHAVRDAAIDAAVKRLRDEFPASRLGALGEHCFLTREHGKLRVEFSFDDPEAAEKLLRWIARGAEPR